MQFSSFKTLVLVSALYACGAAGAHAAEPGAAFPSNDFIKALTGGAFYWEERYHYENVDQAGFRKEAAANTLRSIVGYKTGEFEHFSADLGVVNVTQIGEPTFNDGMNLRTRYPGGTDPHVTQIYMGNLSYTGLPDTAIVGGRQKVALDNQRWVGAANWRQIPQTFDGITASNKSIDDLEIYYGHLFNENRSQSVRAALGTYKMSSDIFHAAYTGLKNIKLIGYSYLTEITNSKTLSTASTGARIEASLPIAGDWALNGVGEYARQVDYADNPNHFGLNYYTTEGGASYGKMSAKIGHEVLEGDGHVALQTPMMAGHPMNGWADMFTTTPANGLEDNFASAAYRFQLPWQYLGESKIEASFHDFAANHVSQHYGNEYDFDFTQKIATNYAVGLQYADYVADKRGPDTRKVVLTLQLNY